MTLAHGDGITEAARPSATRAGSTSAVPMAGGNGRWYVPLTGRARFDEVFRGGRRSRRGGITLIRKDRAELPARVGLVVGRRVGGAVVRNRVKRRLRAALQRCRLPAADYVLIGTAAVASACFDEICSWLEGAARAMEAEGGIR